MDDQRTGEPVHGSGLFGKVMADASARAREYREQVSTGMRSEEPPMSDAPSPIRIAELRGLPETKWDVTFESFDLQIAPRMRYASEAARMIALGMWKAWCLVLSGPWGTGKTHLAYAAANLRRANGLAYRFITAPELMAQLKNSIDEKRSNLDAYGPEEWVKTYGGAKALLIIDDYGSQQDTEWANAQLFTILNQRYDAKLLTLITTNLGARDLDPRVASRCAAGIVVCDGPDQRVRFS